MVHVVGPAVSLDASTVVWNVPSAPGVTCASGGCWCDASHTSTFTNPGALPLTVTTPLTEAPSTGTSTTRLYVVTGPPPAPTPPLPTPPLLDAPPLDAPPDAMTAPPLPLARTGAPPL